MKSFEFTHHACSSTSFKLDTTPRSCQPLHTTLSGLFCNGVQQPVVTAQHSARLYIHGQLKLPTPQQHHHSHQTLGCCSPCEMPLLNRLSRQNKPSMHHESLAWCLPAPATHRCPQIPTVGWPDSSQDVLQARFIAGHRVSVCT